MTTRKEGESQMAGRQYGATWTKMRNQRIRQAADHNEPCCRCGQPIDYQLPGNTRWGPTLDHLDPLAHGGDLTVESTPGEGTTVRFTLPLA